MRKGGPLRCMCAYNDAVSLLYVLFDNMNEIAILLHVYVLQSRLDCQFQWYVAG